MHKHEPIESHPGQGERGPNEVQGGTTPHPGRKARCAPDHISVALSPGAVARAGRNQPAGLLLKSSECLWGQLWRIPRPRCHGEPRMPSAGPFCPQGRGLLPLLGAPLAECPPACEGLPEGVPGEAPASACCGVHQGGGLPSGLIRQGHWGQASGHPPAGTGSLALVWSGGGQGTGG